MPAVGKSTIGKRLAVALLYRFVDTDTLIESYTGEALQGTLNREGHLKLRGIEQQVILDANFDRSVIATGGSAVYGEAAMQKLKSCSSIVYLSLSPTILSQRINNWQTRGIACAPGQTLAQLYAEREPLYQQYADHTINCASQSVEQLTKVLTSLFEPMS